MINIGDNLGYKGIKPNFDRDSFSTISSMIAISDNNIDDGHISYCQETNKHYKFNRSNTIDQTLGKWRLFFSGQLGLSEDIGVNLKIVTDTVNALTSSIALKQNKLTTGSGILISDLNVISATVSSYTYAGTVSTVSNLPTTSTVGYFYCVTKDVIANTNYAWNGSSWQSIGNSLYSLATESKSGLMPYYDKVKINLFLLIDDPQFALTDTNGNIGLKFDLDGFDVNKLGTNIQNLIKLINGISLILGTTSGTAYEGSAGLLLSNLVTQLLNSALQLGETANTAYPGDKGKSNADAIASALSLINKISLSLSLIKSQLVSVVEESFNITDDDGNIGMKYDSNGLDAALLSSHFISLIKAIDGLGLAIGDTSTTAYAGDKGKANADNISRHTTLITALSTITATLSSLLTQVSENGYYISDASGNVAMKYDASGFDVALLSDHIKSLIRQIDGIAGGVQLGETTGTAYDGGKGSALNTLVNKLNLAVNTLKSLLNSCNEEGYYVTDSAGNVVMKYTLSGLDVAEISTHLQALLAEYFATKDEYSMLSTNVYDGLLSIYHDRKVKLALPSTAKILLYGDSISSTDYTFYKDWMIYYSGLSDVYNGGFSGRTAAYIASDAALARIFNYDPDVIIFQTGGNDVGDVVGTFGAVPSETTVAETDISIDYNGTYFIQAVSHIIRKVKAHYYNIVTRAALTGTETASEKIAKINAVKKPYIAFMTPTPQKRSGGNLTWSSEANWIRKRNAIVECCNKYNVHCIDIYSLWGVDMSLEPEWSSPTDKINQNGIYTMDGLHPSLAGYQRISELINGEINIIIK